MSNTYLATDQLAERIHYNHRTIRNELVDSCLYEGQHYIRPFGRRKIPVVTWALVELNQCEFCCSISELQNRLSVHSNRLQQDALFC